MQTTSRALVFNGPKSIELKNYPLVDPAEEGALIKVEACGLCGTDIHVYKGQVPGKSPFPVILGHEIVGTLVQSGKKFTKVDSLGASVKEGDRVFVAPGVSCGYCYKCSVLQVPTRCMNKRAYGFTSNPDQWPHLTGGFADYMHLFIPNSIFLKTSLSPDVATLVEPFSIAIHGLDKAQVTPGDVVVVQGSGAVGLLTLLGAKQSGASKIIVLGAPEGRLNLARELGADIVIDITKVPHEDRIKLINKETPAGLGADVVLECAGHPVAMIEGLEYLRDGGRFVELGNFTDNGVAQINPFRHLVSKNNVIHGVWGALPKHLVRALSLVEAEPDLYRKIISHVVELESLNEMIDELATGYTFRGQDVIKAVVVPGRE